MSKVHRTHSFFQPGPEPDLDLDDNFEEPLSPPRRRPRRQPMSYSARRPPMSPPEPASPSPLTTLPSTSTKNNDSSVDSVSIPPACKSSASSTVDGGTMRSFKNNFNSRPTSATWTRRALSPIGSNTDIDQDRRRAQLTEQLHVHSLRDGCEGSSHLGLSSGGLSEWLVQDGDPTPAQRRPRNPTRASNRSRSRLTGFGEEGEDREVEHSYSSASTPAESPRRLRPLRSARKPFTLRAPVFATGSVRFEKGAPYPTRPRPRMLDFIGAAHSDAAGYQARPTPLGSSKGRPPHHPLWTIESTAFHLTVESACLAELGGTPTQRLRRMDTITRRAPTRDAFDAMAKTGDDTLVSQITGAKRRKPDQGHPRRSAKRKKKPMNVKRFPSLKLQESEVGSYIDVRPLIDDTAQDELCLGPLPSHPPVQPTRPRGIAQHLHKAGQGLGKMPAKRLEGEKNRAQVRGRLVENATQVMGIHDTAPNGTSPAPANGNYAQQGGMSRAVVRAPSFRFFTEGRKKRPIRAAGTGTSPDSTPLILTNTPQLEFPSSRLGQGGSTTRGLHSESCRTIDMSSSGADQPSPFLLDSTYSASRRLFDESTIEATNRAPSLRSDLEPARNGRLRRGSRSLPLVQTRNSSSPPSFATPAAQPLDPQLKESAPTPRNEARPQFYFLNGTNLTARTPTPFRSPPPSSLKESTNEHDSSSMRMMRDVEIAVLLPYKSMGDSMDEHHGDGELNFGEGVLPEWLEPPAEMEPPSNLLREEYCNSHR